MAKSEVLINVYAGGINVTTAGEVFKIAGFTRRQISVVSVDQR